MEHLHRHLLNAQHITGEAGHLIGVEQQGVLLIGAVFGIEPLGIEGGVEVAGIGVGVAIHRCPGAIQGALHVVNADQSIGRRRGQANGLAQGLLITKDLIAQERTHLGRRGALGGSDLSITAQGMAVHARRI